MKSLKLLGKVKASKLHIQKLYTAEFTLLILPILNDFKIITLNVVLSNPQFG